MVFSSSASRCLRAAAWSSCCCTLACISASFSFETVASAVLACSCWFNALMLVCAAGELLLKISLLLFKLLGLLLAGLQLLLEMLNLLFAFAQPRLLLRGCLARFCQFAEQLFALLLFFVQRGAHHGGEVLPAARPRWYASAAADRRFADLRRSSCSGPAWKRAAD